MFKRIACIFIIILLLSCTACSKKINPPSDILTQTILSPDKIHLTILVKNAFSIRAFEQAAEAHFPQLDIIQVGNYTSNMGIEEYKARLKNKDLTDLIMTWPLEVGEEYWEDNLLDLSALTLTSKYTTTRLDEISRNGKLFYLPGPSQIRGIMYNKTLFEENSWSVPKSFDEFVTLCQTIEKSGIRSLQLGLINEEVLDTAFVGYGYEANYSKPEDAHFIAMYNEGKGSFGDHFNEALDTFETLIQKGILKKEDLKVDYSARERMVFARKCAMVEDSALLARIGFQFNGCTDEFALMPFFNPGKKSDWARLYPVCYVGVNKQLAQPENQEKYNLALQVLEYISTPEGQTALAGDTGGMFSSLKDAEPPVCPEIKELIPALMHGRYAVFPTLKNAQGALRKGLAGMVAGTFTKEDVITMVDKQNLSPPIPAPFLVLGQASQDFSRLETGNFLTDAMRKQSGCEIALFLDDGKDGQHNGKGVSGKFYQGDLSIADISRILPDLRGGEKGELWEVTMTGEDLIKTLEYSILIDNNHGGWFYYFSGLKMEYAPAGEPGKRIHKITDLGGKPIDPTRLYSVAVSDESVPIEFLQSCNKTGKRIQDILEQAIQEAKMIVPSDDNRFVICDP